LKITQAYEILFDQERRSLYDDYGTTNEERQGGSGGGGGGGGFQRQSHNDFFRDFDGFESFLAVMALALSLMVSTVGENIIEKVMKTK
jgi:DnaJ-class molecular chaperone